MTFLLRISHPRQPSAVPHLQADQQGTWPLPRCGSPAHAAAQLGGLGAFALPASRFAGLAQQLRQQDPSVVRAIKQLPPLPVVPAVPTAAPIAYGAAPAASAPAMMAPAPSDRPADDKYSMFRNVDVLAAPSCALAYGHLASARRC